MDEEEIERKEIDRLRRRFANNFPNFLKGGYYNSPWMMEDPRKIVIRRDFDSPGDYWGW